MSLLAKATYILCALTALACAVLLLRGYLRTGLRLLLWSGVCFAGLTLENMILFLDMEVIHQLDLSGLRNSISLLSVLALLVGLVWNSRSA